MRFVTILCSQCLQIDAGLPFLEHCEFEPDITWSITVFAVSAPTTLGSDIYFLFRKFFSYKYKFLKKKIKLLELDNIELVKGNFKKSIKKFEHTNNNINVFASNIDCDLYDGYIQSLNFIRKYSKSGTYIHLDEYYSLKFPGAKIATDEFLKNKKNNVINYISKGDDFYRCYIKK